jgi:RecJ-like exonuclease
MSSSARRLQRHPRRVTVDAFAQAMLLATSGEPCSHCDQFGRVDGRTCPVCGGTGELMRKEKTGGIAE